MNGGRRLFLDVCVMVTVGRLLLIVLRTQWRWLLHAQENRSKRMEGGDVCDVLIWYVVEGENDDRVLSFM